MQIQFEIPDEYINELKKRMNNNDELDIIGNGLGLLDWVLTQTAENKKIYAIDEDKKEIKMLDNNFIKS